MENRLIPEYENRNRKSLIWEKLTLPAIGLQTSFSRRFRWGRMFTMQEGEDLMQGKSIRRLVNGVSERVPGTLIATIGLGLAVFTYEMNRMSSFQNVVRNDLTSAIPNFCTIAVLLILATVYIRNSRFRLHRLPIVGFVIAGAASVCILLQAGSSFVPLSAEGVFLIRSLMRVLEVLMLLCWTEVLTTLRARECAVVIALSFLALGIANGLSAFFKDNVVFTLLALLPILSMAFLYWFKDKRESLESGGHTEANRVFDSSLWPQSNSRESIASLLLTYVFPLFGFTFLFGYIHFLWLPSQDGGQASLVIQLGAAFGTLIAGWVLLLLIVHFWGRRQLLMYNLFVLPVLGVALYLTGQVDGMEAFLYVVPLNVCQKFVLFLAMLSPFFIVSRGSHIAVWCVTFSVYTLGKGSTSALYEILDPAMYSLLILVFTVVLIVAAIASVVLHDGRPDEKDAIAASESTDTPPDSRARPQAGEDAGSAVVDEVTAAQAQEAALLSLAHEYRLTRREEEILQLLAKGMTAPAIAEELVVSTSTAKTHIRNIYIKLDIHTQNELLLMVHQSERDLGLQS